MQCGVFIVLTVFATCHLGSHAFVSGRDVTPRDVTQQEINAYADVLVRSLGSSLLNLNVDPFPVATFQEDFWYMWLLSNHSGTAHMSKGWLQGLTFLRRAGNAALQSDKNLSLVSLSAVVEDLTASFDLNLILSSDNEGTLKASVTNQAVDISIQFDTNTGDASLQTLAFVNIGHVNVATKGLGNIGGKSNIEDALSTIFTEKVLSVIGGQVEQSLQNVSFNDLPAPPTATP